MAKHTLHLLNSRQRAKYAAHTDDSTPNPFGIKRLAISIGIAPSTLSKLRHYPNRWPTLTTAVALADALGIEPEALWAAVRKDLRNDSSTEKDRDGPHMGAIG